MQGWESLQRGARSLSAPGFLPFLWPGLCFPGSMGIKARPTWRRDEGCDLRCRSTRPSRRLGIRSDGGSLALQRPEKGCSRQHMFDLQKDLLSHTPCLTRPKLGDQGVSTHEGPYSRIAVPFRFLSSALRQTPRLVVFLLGFTTTR